MSDTTPTPADLARELIRRLDAHAAMPGDIVAYTRLVGHRADHARTIAEALLAAEARVAELEAARKWRDIATAPKDGKPVLMLRKDGEIRKAWWKPPWIGERGHVFHDAGWGGTGWWYDEQCPPVKWMPLPEPPTEDK